MNNNSDVIDREIAAITNEIDALVLDFNKRTKQLKTRLEKLQTEKKNSVNTDTDTFEKVTDRFDKNNSGIDIDNIDIGDVIEAKKRPLQLGDTVVITNNYLYKKGTRGVIVKLTKSRVTLRDTNNALHTRSRNNIQRLLNINLNK